MRSLSRYVLFNHNRHMCNTITDLYRFTVSRAYALVQSRYRVAAGLRRRECVTRLYAPPGVPDRIDLLVLETDSSLFAISHARRNRCS